MFEFLFKKTAPEKKTDLLKNNYALIKEHYCEGNISAERKKELSYLIEKYGYLPYSQSRALEELTNAETFFCLEKKLEINETYKENKFTVEDEYISPVKRNGYKDSDWIKKEQHDIKLINLAALGDGVKDLSPAKFIDWLKQIVILPAGNIEKGILSTTIYLVPFHPRDFGNAYLTASTEEVSEKLCDSGLKSKGLTAKQQIKIFITLAQLAGHPVIYDVFPQNGRYSKTVMVHPELVRWIDVKFLTEEIKKSLNFAAIKISQEFDEDDVSIVKNIYQTTLKSGSVDLTPEFMPIYNRFNEELEEKKKELSNYMTKKEEQKKLQKRVRDIVCRIEGVKSAKLQKDTDITKRGEIINALIEEGLWTLPDGAWCSSGIPVFEKMSEGGAYPIFKHFNSKGHDVSKFADSVLFCLFGKRRV